MDEVATINLMNPVIITTPRTVIRKISEADFDDMLSVYGDLELMRYVGDSTAISEEDCRRWIPITFANYQKRGYGLFKITSPANGECMGFVGLTHPGDIPDPEIKYVLKKEHWGQGLAQEVIRVVTEAGLSQFGLKRIIATIDPDNAASMHLIQKCGYVRVDDVIDEEGSITAVFEVSAPLVK